MLAALTCIELILAVSFATLLDRKFPCRPRASKKSTYSDTSLKRHKIHSRFYGRKPTVIFMAVRDFKYILVELICQIYREIFVTSRRRTIYSIYPQECRKTASRQEFNLPSPNNNNLVLQLKLFRLIGLFDVD